MTQVDDNVGRSQLKINFNNLSKDSWDINGFWANLKLNITHLRGFQVKEHIINRSKVN